MAFSFVNLDDKTRSYMIAEFEADQKGGRLYMSNRLSDAGKTAYPGLLKTALETHDEHWLTAQIDPHMVEYEIVQGKSKKVPHTANETLAESEFNRFYIRGVCLRAIAEGILSVVVYRAKSVTHPRAESEAKVGTSVPTAQLLAEIRSNKWIENSLGIPSNPNSGLSVRLS